MKLLILFIGLVIFATFSLQAQDVFPDLAIKRRAWEEARNAARENVEKQFVARLVDLRTDAVRKGDLDAARAFEKARKGEINYDAEPTTLIELRGVREKALEAAFKQVDEPYWGELKSLKNRVQQEGDLNRLEIVISEMDRILKLYAGEAITAPQKKCEVIIKHAVFGSDAAAVGVIDKIKKYAEDSTRVVEISSSGMHLENPRAYTRDSLLVEYDLDGIAKQIRIPNGKKVNFHELLRDSSAEKEFPTKRGRQSAENLNQYLVNTSWSTKQCPVEEGLIFYSDRTFRRPDNSLLGQYLIIDGETAKLFWGGLPIICKFSRGRLTFREINGQKNTFRFLGRVDGK